MKILLITLPNEGGTNDFAGRDYIGKYFLDLPPLGLLSIATNINTKHKIKVFDSFFEKKSIKETINYILDYKPDILGISVTTKQAYALYDICKNIKKLDPHIKIIVGGPHIDYFPMETMKWGVIDYGLCGFCEFSFSQLIEVIDNEENLSSLKKIPDLYYKSNGKIFYTFLNEKPINLDNFPFPNRELIDLKAYSLPVDQEEHATLNSSRGCPYRCIYCDIKEKKFHYRSAKRVVDEMQEIASSGIKELYILDAAFNILRQRVIDICEEILKRGLKIKWSARCRVIPFDVEMARLMKKAGCMRLHVGIESLDPEVLRFMKKNITLEQIKSFFKICKEFRFEVMAYFMIGFPNETKEYRDNLLEKIKKLDPDYFFLSLLCPYAKTEYYEMLLKNGTYKTDFWAEFAKKPTKDFKIPLPRSEELQKELEDLIDYSYRKFFFRPTRILKELKKVILKPRVCLSRTKMALIFFFELLKKSVINK